MDKLDRLYQLHQLFSARRTPVPVSQLAAELECSEKSVKRYIEQFRLYYDAPLEYLPRKGWRYTPESTNQWEIPGLWLTEQDVQSLLLLLDILQRFGNGLLTQELKAVDSIISRLLSQRGINRSELASRIKIIPVGQRALPSKNLKRSVQALIQRQRLQLEYLDFNNNRSQRSISPQHVNGHLF